MRVTHKNKISEDRNPNEAEFYKPITDEMIELRKHDVRVTQLEWAGKMGINVTGLASIERYNSFLRTHHIKYIAEVLKKEPLYYRFYLKWVKFICRHVLDYNIEISQNLRPVSEIEKELNGKLEIQTDEIRLLKKKLQLAEEEIEILKRRGK